MLRLMLVETQLMAAIVRPTQTILFSDRPRGQVQADLLDAQIHNLVEAIKSTQAALEDIRRDDGKLKSNIVGREQLAVELKHSRQEIDSVEQRTKVAAENAAAAAAGVVKHYRDTDLRARDAEAAAVSAAKMLSAIARNDATAYDATTDAELSAERAESAAITSEGWANYSLANSDNAIAAKDEALQWAEYLAGPVVSGPAAPAYIEGSRFPNGLYYQPVVGMGGLGGLWSAKWWAIYCQQLVGNISFYYLGPWDHPPIPGEVNSETGMMVPNPLAVGSFYYDTTLNTIMIWNGVSWQHPGVNVAAGYRANYTYIAGDNQTMFRGADIHGLVPLFDNEGHEVFLNGVKLVPEIDFVTDKANDSLTLVEAPGAGAVVQWSLMIPPDQINSAKMDCFKMEPLIPDGVKQDFVLTYIDPSLGPPAIPAQVGQGQQMIVSLDGVIQEPAVDYVAIGAQLSMAIAPPADSRFWAVWFRPHVALPASLAARSAMVSGTYVNGSVL